MTNVKVFLSRRNLQTLLSKLDRNKEEPGVTMASLMKNDTVHPVYPQTHPEIVITAIEDDQFHANVTKFAHIHAHITRSELDYLILQLNANQEVGGPLAGLTKIMSAAFTLEITALEDAEYYTDREPGPVNPLDEPQG